jgi:hypothetical protein
MTARGNVVVDLTDPMSYAVVAPVVTKKATITLTGVNVDLANVPNVAVLSIVATKKHTITLTPVLLDPNFVQYPLYIWTYIIGGGGSTVYVYWIPHTNVTGQPP